jgi:hypothetical protein
MPVLVMMCVVSVEVEIGSSSGGGRWIGNVVHPSIYNQIFSSVCLVSDVSRLLSVVGVSRSVAGDVED